MASPELRPIEQPRIPARLRLRSLFADQSGQAMVEYSTFTVFMLVGVTGGSLVLFLPTFMNALNTYLAGIYFMIDAAIP